MTTDSDPKAAGQGEHPSGKRLKPAAVNIKMPDEQPEPARGAARTPGSVQSMAVVEDMLGRLMGRLDENDRRYNSALEELNQRLNELSERTKSAPASQDPATGATLDRLRDQATSLAVQVNEAGAARQDHDRAAGYANGDTLDADLGNNRLNSDFANVTKRLEKSLSSTGPAGELDFIAHRLDDLGHRLDHALSRQSDAATLETIEQQLRALGSGFGEVRQNHARVEAIEENLSRLMHWAQSGDGQANGPDADRLDAIENALNALDSHAREMDARTVRTLEAMNDALHSIAGNADNSKLERTERTAFGDTGREPIEEEALSDVWIEEREDASFEEDTERLEAELGASIPDYQPAPGKMERPERPKRTRSGTSETGNDFLEAARRAAQAAAREPAPEPRRRSFNKRLAGSSAKKQADDAQKPRRILYILAAGLMLTSAGLMYARMNSQEPVHNNATGGQSATPPPAGALPAPTQNPQKSETPAQPQSTPAPAPRKPEKHSERMHGVEPAPVPANVPEIARDAKETVERAKPEPAALKTDDPISTATLLASLTPPPKDPMEGVTFDIKDPEKVPAHRTQIPRSSAMLVPDAETPAAAPAPRLPKRMPAPKPSKESAGPQQKKANIDSARAKELQRPAAGDGPLMSMPPARIGPNSLRVAAARGNPAAQVEIASRFGKGTGVPKDLQKAAEWYGRAATQGYAPAQYRLAAMFERGQGVKQDLDIARSWYRRAAQGGNVRAMHNLAVLYTRNVGKGRDYTSARNWFYQAARHGLADSQFNLGMLYESGLGVRKNPAEAYKWFTLAAGQGDIEAGKRREAIRPALPAKSLAAAEQAIRKWRPVKANEEANRSGPPPGGWSNAAAAERETDANPDEIRRAQLLLNSLGYDAGTPDGKLGPQTKAAITRFQSRTGLAQTGSLSPDVIKRLESLAS